MSASFFSSKFEIHEGKQNWGTHHWVAAWVLKSALPSLYLSVFLQLLHIQCPGFLVVLNGKMLTPSSWKQKSPNFFFFPKNYFAYLFMAAVGLCCSKGFLQLQSAGATLHCSAWASHCGGSSCCRAQALEFRLQQLQCLGSAVAAHQLSCSTAHGILPD